MNKLTGLFAKFLSYIFHPLLMPSIGLLFIFNSGTYLSYIPFDGKKLIFLFVFSGTFILPVCFNSFFIFMNIVDDFELKKANHRVLPLAITGMLFFSTYFILRKYPIPFINAFVLATSVCVFINAVITYWWKISSHMIGVGGLTGLVAAMLLRLNANITGLLILAVLISGFLGFARLRLNAHSQSQVYWGFALGFLLILSILLFV